MLHSFPTTRWWSRPTATSATAVHGCSVRRDALVGMNAVVMDEAEVGEQAMVATCAFVPAGTGCRHAR